MVQQLLTAGSPELHDQIVERSGGNPFFILELVRCLQEGELTETTTAPATLPDTVHAAVLARLDRLSPQERAVLQVASASPRRFRSTMLHVILDTYTAQEIEDALDGLLAREFIVSLEGDFFTFQHMLIHDVTYGTLSRPERVRLHSKIAAWLEVAAADQLDEFIELIAYHFREAIILARQSTIPLALPIDTEHAIHALSRAGKLASRAGLFIEAQTHLRTAIQIAPETKLLDLYEQLGDCTVWGKNATNAYNEALTRWRQTATNQPLVGARLLRKLLICVTRGFSGESLDDEQLLSLREEAMQLAITAGNEDERWRIQLIDLFCHFSPALPVDIQQGKKIAMDAAEHFKQKGDWVAFSEALDGYAGIALKHGHFREALTASQLRLTAADLPAIERSDAFHMIARAYILLGDYDRCITMAEEAFTQIKPTQTQLQFNMFLGDILFAAFLSGQWSKINTFLTTMKDIWEQIKHEPEACWYMKSSDYALLQVAVAQEDHALTNQAISILLRRHPESKTLHRTFITAIQNDDPHVLHLDLSKIEPDITSHALLFHILLFHNEHGIALPEAFIAKANYHRETQNDALIRCGEISRALASTDNSHLEQAIDAAESHQLLAHAARMRVVLAQRTGNPAHLERARPVLQTINDRLYLRKLDEVAATLLPPVH